MCRVALCNEISEDVKCNFPPATGLKEPLNRCQQLPAPYKRLIDDNIKIELCEDHRSEGDST